MRLAALAGVATIEHGNEGDAEVFRLMAEKGVALCPTLAASEAMSKYRGWKQSDRSGAEGAEVAPRFLQGSAGRGRHDRLRQRRRRVRPRHAGPRAGTDGRIWHDAQASPGLAPLRSPPRCCACPTAAPFKPGLLADLIAVEGDPTSEHRGPAQRPLRDEGGRDSSSAAVMERFGRVAANTESG